jgi:hypothetical protein
VAYRQLCALTFLTLGLVAVACGGETGSAAVGPSTDGQAPSNPDQPPGTGADTPPNSDGAPTSTDKPPGSGDAPAGTGAGGRLGQLCQQLCTSLNQAVDRCAMGMSDVGMEDVCDQAGACEVPANIPCTNELADVFDCLLDNIDGVCQTPQDNGNGNNGDNPPQAAQDPSTALCDAALKTARSCLDAAGYDPDTGNMPTEQHGCFAQGGCECTSECETCKCEADTNADEFQACFATGGSCDIATP